MLKQTRTIILPNLQFLTILFGGENCLHQHHQLKTLCFAGSLVKVRFWESVILLVRVGEIREIHGKHEKNRWSNS